MVKSEVMMKLKKKKVGQAFLDRIAKAKAKMNKEEVEVDEAMSNYASCP